MSKEIHEEIVEKGQYEVVKYREDRFDNVKEKDIAYEPYLECPRCAEWKLAAFRCGRRIERGFIRSAKWDPEAEVGWKCMNCAIKYDVNGDSV